MTFKKGYVPWNKGLTKETDPRVKKQSVTRKQRIRSGDIVTWNKGLKGFRPSPKTEFKKGHVSWIKDKKGLCTNTGKTHFKKGRIPWNKGQEFSEETRKRMSEAHMGVPLSESHRLNVIKANKNRLTKNTSIEVAIQGELNKRKINYQTHLLVCNTCIPDIIFSELKIAVFADGDYWHSKEINGGKNWNRDRRTDQILMKKGWKVLRFWGHEIRENVTGCVDKIEGVIG